jgi:large subunit ribosomal protein L30
MGRNPAVGRQGPAYHAAVLPEQPAPEGLRIRQIRSGIGQPETMRRTLAALGLRRHQQEVVVKDTPSVRGMVYKVRHLIVVAPVGEE